MLVRGAPAIAIAGALSLAVELVTGGWADRNGLTGWADGGVCAAHVRERLAHLVASRPTAVNMREAAERLTALADSAAGAGKSTAEVAEAVIEAAEGMLVEDVASNKALGKHGAEAMLKAAGVAADGSESIGVMTICNTGSLATAGYGTALGAIRALHEKGALRQVYACETRPYNQGGRLTAYEIVADGLPGTLIADSAAASAMAQGKVQAVIVGADRVDPRRDVLGRAPDARPRRAVVLLGRRLRGAAGGREGDNRNLGRGLPRRVHGGVVDRRSERLPDHVAGLGTARDVELV